MKMMLIEFKAFNFDIDQDMHHKDATSYTRNAQHTNFKCQNASPNINKGRFLLKMKFVLNALKKIISHAAKQVIVINEGVLECSKLNVMD